MKAIIKFTMPKKDPIVINLKFVSVNREMQIKLIKQNDKGHFQIKKVLNTFIISLHKVCIF